MSPRTIPRPHLIDGKLFWFPPPIAGRATRGLITLGWRFEDATNTDPWSRRFTVFRQGDLRVTRAASVVAVEALAILAGSIVSSSVAMTAVISPSDEYLDPSSPLARLGRHLSDQFSFEWRGDLLRSTSSRPSHHVERVADRSNDIRGSFTCLAPITRDILIVCDDFITTGNTLTEIAHAIHSTSPRVNVIGFALAMNESRHYAASRGVHLDNDHIPRAWAALWDHYARG